MSSYEPVQWELSLDAGARLSRVFTQGYHEQTVVNAPANTTIVQQGPEGTCGYAYGWEVRHNSGGGSFLGMIGHARLATGLSESSFQGCYAGSRFEVPFRDGDSQLDRPGPLPGDETLAREEVRFPGCEAILRERDGYCLTALSGALEVIGLSSGTMCSITPTAAPMESFAGASIAWRGEFAYFRGTDGLTRVSLVDGSFETPGLSCDAVTDFLDGILPHAAAQRPEANGYR